MQMIFTSNKYFPFHLNIIRIELSRYNHLRDSINESAQTLPDQKTVISIGAWKNTFSCSEFWVRWPRWIKPPLNDVFSYSYSFPACSVFTHNQRREQPTIWTKSRLGWWWALSINILANWRRIAKDRDKTTVNAKRWYYATTRWMYYHLRQSQIDGRTANRCMVRGRGRQRKANVGAQLKAISITPGIIHLSLSLSSFYL